MRTRQRISDTSSVSILLVGPYDPHGGEYTFLAPPLGVWRLAGVLGDKGLRVDVFDPNNCDAAVRERLEQTLAGHAYDIIGFSTTGMTLPFDLSLVHLAKRIAPTSVLVGGGMEATFDPERVLSLAPFDVLVLGEGEKPLEELARRLSAGGSIAGVPGTAFRDESARTHRLPRAVLDREELRDAIYRTPYERMPYRDYWRRLESAYAVRALPFKAEREARLAEIRSARLITLNYCPMGCTFCSSTNFLHAAQGKTARIARLSADETLEMVQRIVSAASDVRTIIFQDDIFVFRTDDRILPLCEGIVRAKRAGKIPRELEFISTNRIDAMTPERLRAMKGAGFRVLGFGVESFSRGVLEEFNKAQIYPHIGPVLAESRRLGITPFLDIILTSPRSKLDNLADTVREAYRWIEAGCEVGMYPYVIPFSGAAMAGDPAHAPFTVTKRQRIDGTNLSWEQPAKILPHDERARNVILEVERAFTRNLGVVQEHTPHVPSRVRSLVWIVSAIPALAATGLVAPPLEEALDSLLSGLTLPSFDDENRLRVQLEAVSTAAA